MRHGQGRVTDKFGIVTELYYFEDQPVGIATIRHPNGKRWDVIYKDGKINADVGYIQYMEGESYEGEIVSGKITGRGIHRHSNGGFTINALGINGFHLDVNSRQGYYFQITFENDGNLENLTGVGIVYDKKRNMHYQGEITAGVCVFDPEQHRVKSVTNSKEDESEVDASEEKSSYSHIQFS
jgi:hypothetical protein